jgi:hypothetical protein
MGWIAKLLGAASNEELAGASLGAAPAWSAGHVKEASVFFRALPDLLPSGTILYLEGVCAGDVIKFAERHPAEHSLKIAFGTIWPRPNYFHIPITATTAAELADLAERFAEPEIATHIHAYHDDQILLEWHDAFTEPLRLAKTLPEARVRKFCETVHCNFNVEPA